MLLVITLIMVGLLILANFQKRIPLWMVLLLPIFSALALGYSINEITESLMGKMIDTMRSAGFLMLFALLYFNMLNESGTFETLVNGLVKRLGRFMNVIVLMVLTLILGVLCGLMAQITVAYLIIFPMLLPLYKALNFKPVYCFVLVNSALAAMMFLPWSLGVINVSVVLGCDPVDLGAAASRTLICLIPAIVFQCVYMAVMHKREYGTLGAPNVGEAAALAEAEVESVEAQVKSKKQLRPKMFVPNLLVLVAILTSLVVFSMPAWLMFMFGACYMILFNYPTMKEHMPIFHESSKTYINLLLFMIGISVYLAVFTDMGMVDTLGNAIATYFPTFLSRYMHIILLASCVVCIRYIPNRVFTMLYPVLITMGAQFGFDGMAMIAPFLINLTLATTATPLNPQNVMGCSLLEIEPNYYFSFAMKIQSVTNLISIALMLVMGMIPV